MAETDGTAKTLDELVPAHLPQALRFAIRLTNDADVAEEVVQEALLRAARSWKTFRRESEFQTWLFRIVVNAFRDWMARRPVAGLLPDDVHDPRALSPPDQLVEAELGRLVAAKIAELPARQREVLVLAAYEGLNPREVALVLNISQSNVHATLHLARERLRQELQPYLVEK
jgi:RNA polymerase sigma-70 factor (ECF subfamily)